MRIVNWLGALALGVVAFAGQPAGAAVLGTPSSDTSFMANSTNELNFNMMTPGREGHAAPWVEQIGSGPGEITLRFNNPVNWVNFFEHRINGQQAGTTPHQIVMGDTQHPGTFLSAFEIEDRLFLIPGGGVLDIRLALGAEQDFYFDWTSFSVAPSAVIPLPASLPLLLAGLGALGMVTRRRRN